jgi:hypothetical protein
MKADSEKIRSDLLAFWNDQLNMNVGKNAIHVAYPLLMPDGWQVSFSIYRVQGPSIIYRMSDNAKVFEYLVAHRILSKKAQSIISEKCKFFDVHFECGKIIKEFSRLPLPVEIELFAESVQALAYLVYREQEIPEINCAARKNFAKIIETEKINVLESTTVDGSVVKSISVDYVIEERHRVVCKIAEKSGEVNNFMEMWGFRFSDIKRQSSKTKTLMVYNHESCRWTHKSLAIGRACCDLFIEYNKADEIIDFIKAA